MSKLTRALAGVLAMASLAAPAAADELVVRGTLERLRGTVTADAGTFRVQGDDGPRSLPAADVLVHLRDDGTADLPAADGQEDAALLHESRGRFEAGYLAYAEATRLALSAVEAGVGVELAAARIELYVRRLDFFAGQAGRRAQALALCQQVIGLEAVPASTRDVALTHAAAHLRALGRFDEAAALERDQLGVLTGCYLAGSFDNERGTGFATAYPPEKQPLDLGASWPGKQFPVGWRLQPLDHPPGGVIDLDQLLRPNDQALAYAVFQLEARQETVVALHVGCDDGWALWVNREALGARDIQRPYRADQDLVLAVLQPGVNEVLLKLSAQTGPWRLRLRVSAPEGGPAPGVTAVPVPDPSVELPAPAAHASKPPLSGIDVLERRAQTRPDDWRAWFHLGYLRFAYQSHDRGEHPDRDALNRACELNPQAAFLRVFLAFSLQGEAQFSVNREDNARRLALEEAVALDPGSAEARLLLARHFAADLGNVDRARALLAPALEQNPHYAELAVLAAELDAKLGLGPLATARLSKLHDELAAQVSRGELGAIPAPILRARLEAARSRNDVKARIGLLQALGAQDARLVSPPFRQAMIAWRAGRGDEAELQLRRAVALDPYDTRLRSRLTDLLASRGDLEGADAALQDALAIAPDDADLVEKVGHLALRLGDEPRAAAQFAQALELDPNDVELRDYVDFRARHAEKTVPFEADWTLDTEPMLTAARERALDPRLTHRYLLRQKVAKVYVDGRTSAFVQELIRIENEVGARQFASYGARYESDQQLEFQLGRVYRKAGGREDVPVQTFRPRSGGEFTRGLSGGVRFPPLEPGDVIEIRYRVDDLKAGFFGDYYGEVTYFQTDQPLDMARFVLLGPTDRTFHFHTPGFEKLGGTREQVPGEEWTAHVFTARDVPKFESEPNQPWAKESLPQVQVSTFADWDDFASWYWGLVRGQHEADPAIKAKVQELCEGAETPLEKIRRIYNYVVTDIRYNASWEFGIHGFKPYNATRIFARKFGDCKDKSTLINTMLREVGIDSRPVLIFGQTERGTEDLTLPLMGHFNHCISWVDFGEGGIFVDGTAEHHPFGTLPTMDYGATVVVITPEQGVLRQIPFRGPEANSIREQHTVKLHDDGGATVESVIEGEGDFGIMLRSWLATAGRRKEVLEPRIGSVFSGAHVKSVECSDLTDLDQPVRLEIQVELPRATQETTRGQAKLQEVKSWLFDMIYLRGRKLANLAADAVRVQDLILPVPSEVQETVIYELPPGTKIESLPPPTHLKTGFGRYERVYTQNGDKLEVRRVLRIDTQRIPASAYEEFRTFVGEVQRAESLSPVLSKGSTEQ